MYVFGFIHFIFSARKVLRRHCPIENFSTKLITRQLCRKYSCGQIIQKVLKSWQLLCLPTILKGYLCPFCKKRGIFRYNNTITEPEQIRTHKNFFVAAMLIFSSSGLEVPTYIFIFMSKKKVPFFYFHQKKRLVGFCDFHTFYCGHFDFCFYDGSFVFTAIFILLFYVQLCSFPSFFVAELEKRERERK